MAARLEGDSQLQEILFQDPIDSLPHRQNYQDITNVISLHASDIEALLAGDPASGSEVVSARDQQPDLGTAIRKADEIVGDAIAENVLNDFLVKQSAVPDDKVVVDTGEAIIEGIKVRNASTQAVDPADFSLGITDPRIDVVYQTSSGTVAVVTGTPAASPEAEARPDNTVELARLFLRPSGADPNVPNDIRNTDDLTDSFIVLNLQRFFVQRNDTDRERHPANWINNGAFLTLDAAGVITGWTTSNGTLAQDSVAANRIYGDLSGRFEGDGVAGGSSFSFLIPTPTALRGKFVTISVFIKLDSGTISKTGRITVVQIGDTPDSDFSASADLNDQLFQRIHVTGRIDNSVTAISVKVEVDTTDPSTVVGFIDGVQLQVGRILTAFEYPVRLAQGDDIDFEGNLAWSFTPPFDIFANVKIFTGT